MTAVGLCPDREVVLLEFTEARIVEENLQELGRL